MILFLIGWGLCIAVVAMSIAGVNGFWRDHFSWRVDRALCAVALAMLVVAAALMIAGFATIDWNE